MIARKTLASASLVAPSPVAKTLAPLSALPVALKTDGSVQDWMTNFCALPPSVASALSTEVQNVESPTIPTACGFDFSPAETCGVASGVPGGIGTISSSTPAALNAGTPIAFAPLVTAGRSVTNNETLVMCCSAAYLAIPVRSPGKPPVHA